jgi:hypothetical protein
MVVPGDHLPNLILLVALDLTLTRTKSNQTQKRSYGFTFLVSSTGQMQAQRLAHYLPIIFSRQGGS